MFKKRDAKQDYFVQKIEELCKEISCRQERGEPPGDFARELEVCLQQYMRLRGFGSKKNPPTGDDKT